MKTKYYRITKDLNYHNPEGWQLLKGNIIQDVGTNMFIAKNLNSAMENSFSQLNDFETELVKLYLKYNIEGVEL